MSDAKWSRRKTLCVAVIASAVLWAAIVYVAGRYLPWDTTGEGPKPENYPGE